MSDKLRGLRFMVKRAETDKLKSDAGRAAAVRERSANTAAAATAAAASSHATASGAGTKRRRFQAQVDNESTVFPASGTMILSSAQGALLNGRLSFQRANVSLEAQARSTTEAVLSRPDVSDAEMARAFDRGGGGGGGGDGKREKLKPLRPRR